MLVLARLAVYLRYIPKAHALFTFLLGSFAAKFCVAFAVYQLVSSAALAAEFLSKKIGTAYKAKLCTPSVPHLTHSLP